MAAKVANGPGPDAHHGPGFFAPSIEVLLKQRAEWLEGLGKECVLDADDLSSGSEICDIEAEEAQEEAEEKKANKAEDAAADAATAEAAGPVTKILGPIDDGSISYAESYKIFKNAEIERSDDDDDCMHVPVIAVADGGKALNPLGLGRRGSAASFVSTSSKMTKSNEPLPRRLARVRGEVEAFCTWADGHKAASDRAAKNGGSIVLQEAEILSEEVRKIANLFHLAEDAHTVGPDASSKRVWLPPSEADSIHMVRHLIDYSRFAQGHDHVAGSGAHATPVSYSFSAKMGKQGGWLAAAENEVLGDLEGRLARIGRALGQTPSSSAEGGLAGTMSKLQRRLDTLQQVNDAAACERLRSTAKLLSADIDMAIAEARHLEAVEADAGPDLFDEDTLANQVDRLHEHLSKLDAVAQRIVDISKHLSAQEEQYDELANFSRDLSGAEAQATHAKELLSAAGVAAQEMKKTTEANKVQLQANVKALERKLGEWQERVAKAEAAKAEAAAAAALAEQEAVEEGHDKEKKHKKEDREKKEKK